MWERKIDSVLYILYIDPSMSEEKQILISTTWEGTKLFSKNQLSHILLETKFFYSDLVSIITSFLFILTSCYEFPFRVEGFCFDSNSEILVKSHYKYYYSLQKKVIIVSRRNESDFDHTNWQYSENNLATRKEMDFTIEVIMYEKNMNLKFVQDQVSMLIPTKNHPTQIFISKNFLFYSSRSSQPEDRKSLTYENLFRLDLTQDMNLKYHICLPIYTENWLTWCIWKDCVVSCFPKMNFTTYTIANGELNVLPINELQTVLDDKIIESIFLISRKETLFVGYRSLVFLFE